MTLKRTCGCLSYSHLFLSLQRGHPFVIIKFCEHFLVRNHFGSDFDVKIECSRLRRRPIVPNPTAIELSCSLSHNHSRR